MSLTGRKALRPYKQKAMYLSFDWIIISLIGTGIQARQML
jgi:hypothetical protein